MYLGYGSGVKLHQKNEDGHRSVPEAYDMDGLNGAGAGFLRQLAKADKRRPFGIQCNVSQLHVRLHISSTPLIYSDSAWTCAGPLFQSARWEWFSEPTVSKTV